MLNQACYKRLLVIVAIVLFFAPASHAATVVSPPQARLQLKGPTDNITKVANAISVRAKSLTTFVVVAPGFALTQPVTISIGYFSTAASNRLTEAAASAKVMVPGLKFRENDPGLGFSYDPPRSPSRTSVILVPGKSRMIRGVVSEEKSQWDWEESVWAK